MTVVVPLIIGALLHTVRRNDIVNVAEFGKGPILQPDGLVAKQLNDRVRMGGNEQNARALDHAFQTAEGLLKEASIANADDFIEQ